MSSQVVLHVAAHYGGGVGADTQNLIKGLSKDKRFSHNILSLDKMVENPFKDLDVMCFDNCFDDQILQKALIDNADYVIFHYWNHPLMAVFINRIELERKYVFSWVHVSGMSCMNRIPNSIYDKSSLVIYTSAISNDLHSDASANARYKNTSTVHSIRDLSAFYVRDPQKRKFPLKKLVYVGTINPQKMHQQSALIFSRLASIGYSIDIVGEDTSKWLINQFKTLEGISFKGKLSSPAGIMKCSDIFVYPLRSDHYGTGEQVLEALACRLPVVAMNNAAEREILLESGAGYLANNIDEFIGYVEMLSSDPIFYDQMSASGYAYVSSRFKSQNMYKAFEKILTDAKNNWEPVTCNSRLITMTDAQLLNIFLENAFTRSEIEDLKQCSRLLDGIADKLESYKVLDAKTKGSPYHYAKYFDKSPLLRELCQLLDRRLNQK